MSDDDLRKFLAALQAFIEPQVSSPNTEISNLESAHGNRQSLQSKWDDHSTFTVEEVGEIFGLSRPAAYAAVKNGTVASVRIGRRLIIPRSAIERLLS